MPDPSPSPSKPQPAAVAWGRAQQYLDKLFEALGQLDEAGGIVRAADEAGWKPATLDKAAGSLLACREAITTQLMRVEARRKKHYPRKGRAG